MPLAGTGPILGAAIQSAREATAQAWKDALGGAQPTPADYANLRQQIATAEGNAIVAHILANAVVLVASVSGVTSGGGASGPGTGTLG